jgi:hypothetical protein
LRASLPRRRLLGREWLAASRLSIRDRLRAAPMVDARVRHEAPA